MRKRRKSDDEVVLATSPLPFFFPFYLSYIILGSLFGTDRALRLFGHASVGRRWRSAGSHPRKETSDTSPSLRSRIIRTISGWEGRPVQSRWAAQQRPSPDDWIFCQVFFVCCAARHLNDSLDSLVLMADGRPVTPDRLTIQTI